MRREWTQKEESYMKMRYLSQPIKTTAEKLDRTENSVKRKACKMGLSHYNDSLNAKTIARCFNVDVSVVIRWIKKYELPCSQVICKNQTRYIVNPSTFWGWAEHHKDIINWRKYEKMSICPEPAWLDTEIKQYIAPKSREKYTQEEIVRIKNMLHRGLKYKEIAVQMGRTYYGISHLCRNIYINN